MKLGDWMTMRGVSVQAVADGVSEHLPPGETCSVGAVEKWKRGLRVPRPRKMIALITFTKGQVTANDFANAPTMFSDRAVLRSQ